MVLLNFSHPLPDSQLARVAELVGHAVRRVIQVPTHFDHAQPFADQVRALCQTIDLSAEEWQSIPLIVNLPSFAPIAAVLLAELHGRTGYLPTIVRARPVPHTTPPQFEVAEVLNLHGIRELARQKR